MIGCGQRQSALRALPAERLGVCKQARRLDAERARQPDQVPEADVPFPALDPAEVGAMNPTASGKLLLRQPGRLAQGTDGAPERLMVRGNVSVRTGAHGCRGRLAPPATGLAGEVAG